jgi:fumarate hydratase class II
MRWLASGPRCGLAKSRSRKTNRVIDYAGQGQPDPVRSPDHVCCQVMGNDVAVNIGGASGNFELNVYRPMVIHNFLQSVRLLADGMASFNEHCAVGIEPNRERISQLLNESLMLVTALNTHIGYDKAAEIAKKRIKRADPESLGAGAGLPDGSRIRQLGAPGRDGRQHGYSLASHRCRRGISNLSDCACGL